MDNVITTKRLIIRLLQEDDINELEKLESDADVKQYFPGGPRGRDKTEDMIRRFMATYLQKKLPSYVIFDRETHEFVGRCGFGLLDDEVEVGYVLHKKFWGQGFASETLAALLCYAKENLMVDHIVAYSFTENVGSIRVMEKCGMTFVKSSMIDGIPHSHYRFSM